MFSHSTRPNHDTNTLPTSMLTWWSSLVRNMMDVMLRWSQLRYKMLRRSQNTLTSQTLRHCNLVLIIILNLLLRFLIIILRLLLKALIVIFMFLELSLLSLLESERFSLLDLTGLILLLWEVSPEDLLTVPSPGL